MACKGRHQNFTNKILAISWPWALFGSRFLMIFRISSLVKPIIDRDSWPLQVFIWEHCFTKKVLNISSFLLKSIINLFSCSNGGIQGILLSFRNVFNIDQYDFGLVAGSNSLLNKRAYYLCLDFMFRWISSFMSWCNPNWETMSLILEPS